MRTKSAMLDRSRFSALSRVMLPKTGIMMNNGITWFDPRPGSANQIAASARPVCNMCPVIVATADGGWPKLAAGASGGRRILASVYQTHAFSLDFNMDVGAAAHAPRIDVSGPSTVTADMRLPDDVLGAPAACAPLKVLELGVLPINFACPNLIALGREGARACSDVASPWSAAVAVSPR
jgi:gamma-glutamyltranspeptidase/glutathione hydrolase